MFAVLWKRCVHSVSNVEHHSHLWLTAGRQAGFLASQEQHSCAAQSKANPSAGVHGEGPPAEGNPGWSMLLDAADLATTVCSTQIRSPSEVHGFDLVFICCQEPSCKLSLHRSALWKQNKTTELWCTPSAICPVYSSGNYICFSFTRAQQEPK